MESPGAPVSAQQLGPYKLGLLLGEGGMGKVYRAFDDRLGRWVAAKRVRGEATERGRARLLQEARTLARLGHPAIVQIFDVVEDAAGDWIVMELIEGPTLTELMRDGPLEPSLVLDYGRQIASALEAAHSLGVVHRDLKNENVMALPSGYIKVLDFGLARRTTVRSAEDLPVGEGDGFADSLSRSGRVVGTPRAMSPEQAAGRRVDARSDLFALGTLLYEVLTGRSPFAAANVAETLRRVQLLEPPPVQQLRARVPGRLSQLVERLLDKDPSRRPTSAGAVEAELTAIRVGQTLLGQRPGESGADTPERDTGFDEATRSTPVDSVQVITLLVSVVESRVSASQAAAEGAAVPAEPGSGRWVSDLRSRHGGREIRQDDLQLVLFDQPSSAVRYALAYHHGLEALAEQARIGIHLGEVVLRYNTPEDVARGAAPVEVEGPAPPTVSRLLALTSAGQTLLSRAAYAAARRRGRGEPDGELTWRCHGWYRFRDLADELEVFEVSRGAARPLAPPSGTSAWASGSGAATHGQAAAAVVGDPPEGCVPHEGRRAAVALRTWPAPEIPDQPYPVLLPYRHPKFLAGRDGEISRLRRLLQMPVPILGLSAPSGNGKSSLLIGGLVPKLRAAGVPVALVRHPTEAGLATRLIGDLLHGFEGPADDDPGRFVVGLGEAERLGGSPPVLVLDQFEDVLQQGAARARAALGVLMATSVTRRADSAGPPCRWLVAYRREFFGALREWLGDVLADARAEGATAIEALPHDLSSVDRFHGMSLSPLATPSPGVEDPLAESTRVFLAAIEAPLLPSDPAARGGATRSGATRSGATRDGPTRDDRTRDAAAPEGAAGEAASVRRFPWSFRPGHAERLARAFAAARLARPDAPLVPELQVVLAHLLAEADAEGRIAVPQDPAPLIDQALDHHLRRALEGAFPAGAATSSTRRARALLALRQLATAVGRRQEGLAASELARAIGHDGEAVLRRLATPLTRLVVPREGPEGLRWVLAHDRMAEAVVRLVEAEGRQGRLLIDAELLGLRRFVTLRTELFRSGATWTATLVSRRRFQRIEEHADALLTDGERRAWFDATRAHRQSAYRRWAALAGVALIVLALIGWLAWTQTELLAARRALREQVATGEPTTAFRALAHLAADLSTEPAELLGLLRQREAPADVLEWGLEGLEEPQRSVAVLRAVELALPWVAEQPEDPVLIGNLVWALDFAPARLPVLADQAAELRRQVLAPLRRQRPPPPRPAADDPQWIDVPAGTFLMGTADDQEGTADERPQHEVSVAAFRMQRHEVTLADYRQFEPGHQPGRAADLPAAYFSWHEAYTYAAWLGGRLPTEAEWEYAARAGCRFDFCRRDGQPAAIDSVAWTLRTSLDSRTGAVGPQPVMHLEPNPWGFYDMLGNLFEWTADGYAPYPAEPRPDAWGDAPNSGRRMYRGGSFRVEAHQTRVALRIWFSSGITGEDRGLRVVLPGS